LILNLSKQFHDHPPQKNLHRMTAKPIRQVDRINLTLLSRAAPVRGLVTLRQRFVRRCQKGLRELYRERAIARARAAEREPARALKEGLSKMAIVRQWVAAANDVCVGARC